jgi:peptidoglycan/xylan/chitin deacetylase (PgdA/CDA1 family)
MQKLTRARLARQSLDQLQGRLIRRGGVTGLCYHAISDDFPAYPYTTTPETFDDHLAFLSETFDIQPLHQVVQTLRAGPIPATRKPLAFLSFDDAYRDNLHVATPLLERYGLHATLFAPRDLVVQNSATHMSLSELQQIAAHPLADVGSHGLTHNILPAFAPEDIQRELSESRAWLEAVIEGPVSGFAYPQGAISPKTIDLARDIYTLGVTTDRRIGAAFDLLQIRRHCPDRSHDPVKSLVQGLLLAPHEAGA